MLRRDFIHHLGKENKKSTSTNTPGKLCMKLTIDSSQTFLPPGGLPVDQSPIRKVPPTA
jgi:hypothetical protein